MEKLLRIIQVFMVGVVNSVIQFAFKIIKLGSGIMIGIVQNRTYNIDNNGSCYNHDQPDKNDKQIAFGYSTNDIIIVEVDIIKKYVKWKKQSTNKSLTFSIDTTKDLYSCVHLLGYCKVEILNLV
ncbi:unnamed protein product [Paramecium sonneborni]|uniref:Uncharacterized protein n=1 Tax=Paramecium sonneborni TaxID=65129 RepID=A0A8S1QT99_9CILI|nr:unnamed protein product [Paramecium sonneborni]